MTKKFLTVKDLAALFNLKESWIYDRTARNGPEVIPHVKFGRQVRFDIESEEFHAWEVAWGHRRTQVIDSMKSEDLLLGSVELTGAFTTRKERRVNADTYQEGWIEWKMTA